MTTALTRLQQMLAACDQGHHRYAPTWTVGHLLCEVCGKRAMCPVCVPPMPATKQHLALCVKHKLKEETP